MRSVREGKVGPASTIQVPAFNTRHDNGAHLRIYEHTHLRFSLALFFCPSSPSTFPCSRHFTAILFFCCFFFVPALFTSLSLFLLLTLPHSPPPPFFYTTQPAQLSFQHPRELVVLCTVTLNLSFIIKLTLTLEIRLAVFYFKIQKHRQDRKVEIRA
jgi:hypothetical protein